MADNPYTLVFGKEPVQMISRLSQASDIIDQFTRAHSPPADHWTQGRATKSIPLLNWRKHSLKRPCGRTPFFL